MKKFIVKTLSAFLALALILSMLPMAAFAAQVGGATPASITCKDEEHIYSAEGVAFFEDKGLYHCVEVYDACVICAYRRSPEPIATYNEVHETIVTDMGIDEDVGLRKYQIYCVWCYHIEYEYK